MAEEKIEKKQHQKKLFLKNHQPKKLQ